MNIPLDEVVYFDAITTTPSTGAAVDADSPPTFAVYEESTDTDIGVGGSMTKRTSLTGNYRGSITLSAANGFEVGKWYSIIGTAIVGGVTGKGVLKSFRVVAAESLAGYPKSDLAAILGVAQSATDLKDFVDTGYDPATHKVQGVVLVDTLQNHTAQTGDAFLRIGVNGAGLTALGDTRLAFLDASVSADPSGVTTLLTRLTALRAGYLDNLSAGPVALATGVSLTSGERTTLANVIEAEIIDDTDSEKVLEAITNKIASVNPSLSGLTLSAIAAAVRDIVNTSPAANSLGAMAKLASELSVPSASANATQVRTELATELGRIDASITSRTLASAAYATLANQTKVLSMMVDTGGGIYQFTEDALELAPAGGGGSGASAEELWEYTDRTLSGGDVVSLTEQILARLLASGTTITVGSIWNQIPGTAIPLIIGDDYSSSEGRSIPWPITTEIDLTGATITLYVYATGVESATALFEVTCTKTTTDDGYIIYAEILKANTNLLSVRKHRYEIKAVLANTHTVTLYRHYFDVTN